jgi:hypothetical protein
MIDHEEIARLVDWAEASHIAGDGEWYQGLWGTVTDCGTSCCIAGKWALDHGWSLENNAVLPWRDPQGERWSSPAIGPRGAGGGMGLDEGQADVLFFGANTIDDLRRIAKRLRTEDGL